MPLTRLLMIPLLYTLVACTQNKAPNHALVSIPEASGIAYCPQSNTLVIANDEGSYYEISPKGEIRQQYHLGDYDLEGVVCHPHSFVFAVENGYLLEVERQTQKQTKLTLNLGDKKIKISKKRGIEGLAYHDGLYYLSIQNKKRKPSKILVLKREANQLNLKHVIIHPIQDAAGLVYQNEKLYIVSDKKEKLYRFDLKREEIEQEIKLKEFAQEGIAFDKDSNVYFADDDGGVFKYTRQELGL